MSNLRDELQVVLEQYVQARQAQAFPGVMRSVFERLAEAVAELPSVRARQGLVVKAGFGVGRWSRTPWVCVMDPRASVTPQAGVYINLRFRQDMSGFYLALTQGNLRDVTERGRKAARELWRRRVEALRAGAEGLKADGFHLGGNPDLRLDDPRGNDDYVISTAAWRFHPAGEVPDDSGLDREVAALLDVYLRWLDQWKDEADPFDETALDELRQRFLERLRGFESFARPGPVYPVEERDPKDELARAFQADVQPLFAAPLGTVEASEQAIQALADLLTRRRFGQPPAVQNLVGWRATDHLRKLRGEEAVRAAGLFALLLDGTAEASQRVEEFSSDYLPILARHVSSGVQSITRTLPTLLLMLAEPEREICVRTTLFNSAARALLGHRLLSDDPMSAGDYVACREFANRLRQALDGWGWQPQDMIDVQGFLWVSDPSSYGSFDGFRDALDSASERSVYKIAPGAQAKFWDECRKGEFICVGWDEVGDLRNFSDDERETFVELFRKTFPEEYTGSAGKLATGTRKARELWQMRDIQPGDIILANRGVGEILAMGEVIEPGYEFDPTRDECQHLLRVRWNESLGRDLRDLLPTEKKPGWSNNTIVPVERDLYRVIFNDAVPASIAPLPGPADDEEAESYQAPSFEQILNVVSKSKLLIDSRTLRRYHAAVLARGFVILAGVSGTGKTWLAETYADAVSAKLKIVRVAPNWHSNEDLLGYVSPISGDYHHTELSEFLIAAAESFQRAPNAAAARPYHVLLDEMNLARVEHYFADFLSCLEQRQRQGHATLQLGTQQVAIHQNLIFVGTVNMDETTHGFSQKVFDRAQLIEIELDQRLFASRLEDRVYGDVLLEIRSAVEEVAPIAFRTADDIALYMERARELGADEEEAFDEAVLQKILPRIGGNEPGVREALDRLVEITRDRCPLSHAKAQRMLNGFDRGVASFF